MNIHLRKCLRFSSRSFNPITGKSFHNPKFLPEIRNFSTKRSSKFENYYKEMTENIEKQKEEELKSLNESLQAENYQLAKKVRNILDSSSSDEVKTINIVNEINNVNIKTTEQLLTIHQKYVFGYNYNFIEFVLVSYERIISVFSPRTVFFLLSFYLGYKFYQNRFSNKKVAEPSEILKYYRDNYETVFKQDTILPAFLDHKNITNLLVGGRFFLLNGPKGVGKSYSIKNYCQVESSKDTVVIYKDLNTIEIIENPYEFIVSNIIETYKKGHGRDIVADYSKVFEELRGRRTIFVLDHFTNAPGKLSSLKQLIDILRSHNISVILVSDNSEPLDFAIQGKIR